MFDPDDIASTDIEWDNAEAAELSYLHQDRAWFVTDRDVAHANPYYKGEPVCHPECGCEGEGPRPGCITNPPLKAAPRATYFEDVRGIEDGEIPF